MKPKHFPTFTQLSLPQVIKLGTALGAIFATSPAQAVDYYKANNTTSLNANGSWQTLAGGAVATTPANSTTSSDTWSWDDRVTGANSVGLGNDLGTRTIKILNPGGAVTISGGGNRTISVANGGGVDMSLATQDLTITNLNNSSNVGFRLGGSNFAATLNVPTGRTLNMEAKIAVAGGSSGATVNFTGAGKTICTREVQPSNINISAGEVQFNNATGSTRISTNATNINGGKLVVNNTSGSATGSGTVNVNSTGTLTGQGIMSGLVSVKSGGTIVPGLNGIGSLKAGSLTLAIGSTLNFEADPLVASSADLIEVTASNGLTINGGTITLHNTGTTDPFTGSGTYNLFSYVGALGGSGLGGLSIAEESKIPGQTYSFGISGNFVTLTVGADTRPKAYWNVDANGSWFTPENWTGLTVPNASEFVANLGGPLGTPITTPRTITLSSAATVGTLNFDSAQPFTLSGTNNLTFNAGSTAAMLNVANGSHTISTGVDLPLDGILCTITNPASTLTLGGTINGDSGISKSGPGTLVFTADNFYNGTTTNGSGVLQLGAGGTEGSLNGPIISSGTVRVNRSNELNLFYPISGTGNLDFAGTGTTILGVANSFSGPTTISAGSLIISDNQALQNSTLNYTTASGELTLSNAISTVVLGALAGDKPFPLTNQDTASVGLNVGQNNASTSYSASTVGTGTTFTKAGSGTFSLTGTHAFTGTTTINGGVLSLNADSSFTSGGVNTSASGAKLRLNGGTLQSNGSSVITNTSSGFEITSGTATFTGSITNTNPSDAGAFFVNVTGGTLNAGSMSLIRGGLSLTSEPTAGQTGNGLYINGGNVSISGALSIGNGSNSSVSSRLDSGTLTVGGATNIHINNSSGQSRWNVLDIAGGIFTCADTTTGIRLGGTSTGTTNVNVALLSRGGVMNVGRIQFGQQDTPGNSIFNLTGGNVYVGSGGMVVGSTNSNLTARLRLGGGVLGASADSVSSVPISITGTAVMTGADALDAPQNVTFSGKIDGSGSLTKSGSGTVNLTSTNIVIAGTVNVTSGTLGISGQTGAVTVAPEGTIIPRTSLTPQASSTIHGSLGIRYDTTASLAPGRLHSQGTLTLGPGSTLDINGTGTLTAPFYILASGSAGVSGTFGTVNGIPSGYSLSYNFNNGSGFPVVALVGSATGYDLWAASYGLTGATAGANADPDNDGLHNLMEYALGRSPIASDGPGPALGRSGDFLTLSFNHVADPTLVYSIEASDTLGGTWNTVHTFPAFTTTDVSVYTDNVAISSGPHRFIRLSVKTN